MTPDSLLVLITENNAQASCFSVTSVNSSAHLAGGELNDLPDVAEGAPKPC
jgi:hypothetical protein